MGAGESFTPASEVSIGEGEMDINISLNNSKQIPMLRIASPATFFFMETEKMTSGELSLEKPEQAASALTRDKIVGS